MSYRTKLVYGVGDVANGIKMVIFGIYTLFFCTTVMGVPGALVGLVGFIVLVWDALIDPYIGYLSDKARFRFGNRHTFMLIGALTLGVSFWAFFSPPRSLSIELLFVWFLVTSLAMRTALSIYSIPYYALGAALSEDYHERTSVTGVRSMLTLLGTLLAASLSFVIFFPDTNPGTDPKLNSEGYPQMGLTFGLVMTLVGLIATFGTLSWRTPEPPPAHVAEASPPPAFFASIVQALRHRLFRILFFSFSLFFLGVVVNTSLALHYLTYYVKITDSAALSSLQLAFYGGAVAGVFFWLRAAKRVEKHHLCMLAASATAVLMVAALLLFGEGRLFGTGSLRPLLILHGLAGFFACIVWFIPQSMLADIADDHDLATGQRQEGSLFGIFSFGQQVATGLSLLLVGVLVDWFAGLNPGVSEQSALTVDRIGLLYAVVPGVLLTASAAMMLRYSLTRARVAAVRAELDRLRVGRNRGHYVP